VLLLLVGLGGARAFAARGPAGAEVTVYYGPLCHWQLGALSCASHLIPGVEVTVATYPGLKPLAAGLSDFKGRVAFDRALPSGLAVLFKGHVNDHPFDAGFGMTDLRQFSGKTVRVDLLLCPSDQWVATLDDVADSCSQRGAGVLAYGAHGTS